MIYRYTIVLDSQILTILSMREQLPELDCLDRVGLEGNLTIRFENDRSISNAMYMSQYFSRESCSRIFVQDCVATGVARKVCR